MINENNEIVISTQDAVSVLNVIGKMGMKEDIFNAIKKYFELTYKKESKFNELRDLLIKKHGLDEYEAMSEVERESATKNILVKNKAFREDFEASNMTYNTEMSAIVIDLVYTFASKIPYAEKEVYQCLAKISGVTAEEISKQELDKTIELIMEIVGSKTFLGFSKLLNR